MGRKSRAVKENRDPAQKMDEDGTELTAAADGAQSTTTKGEFITLHVDTLHTAAGAVAHGLHEKRGKREL